MSVYGYGQCVHNVSLDQPCMWRGPARQCVTGYPLAPIAQGCIYPPGANKECEAPMCPRKPAQSVSMGVAK